MRRASRSAVRTPKDGRATAQKSDVPPIRDRRLEVTPNLGAQSQPAGSVPQHTPDVNPLDDLAGQAAELQ